ncbi:MAG TPA: glycosyltransferase family 39 protein [Gemmatimonadaceae bacterium]|nr:glycosyltransferase family 39 protein [Gemmatimonadaceae bacterium]
MKLALRGWWADEPPALRLALGIVFALGVLLRLAYLRQPMRYDESVTWLYFIGKPWHVAVSSYPFPNNHLLYTLLAKVTSAVAPGTPWAMRIPAFLAGVAVLPLTYAVGRTLFSTHAAAIGTALVAASTPLALYSTNARGYSMVDVAFLALLLLLARARDGRASPGLWAGVAAVSAAGLIAVPTMLYPLGAAVLWFTLVQALERPQDAWRRLAPLAAALVAAAVVALLAYQPIIRANGVRALAANKFVAPSPWPDFFQEFLPSVGDTLASWTGPFPLVTWPLLAIALAFGAARSTRLTREGIPVATATLAWCALLLLTGHHAPFARVWQWFIPIACLLAGVAVELLLRRWLTGRVGAAVPRVAVALCAATVAFAFASDDVGTSRDSGLVRGAASVAREPSRALQPGDRVLAPIPSNAPLQFYMLREHADTATLSTPDDSVRRVILVLDPAEGQTLRWAEAAGILDTSRFGPVSPAMHATDMDVFVAERKGATP